MVTENCRFFLLNTDDLLSSGLCSSGSVPSQVHFVIDDTKDTRNLCGVMAKMLDFGL